MKKVRILSIDGGGIRGVIPATILCYVEQKLQELSGRPNARIADYFDMIVGTSTGGILACFYLVPHAENKNISAKYTADQALKFYANEGYNIFNRSKRKKWFGLRQLVNATQYDERKIEGIFNQEFGGLKMSQLLKKCLITTYCMKYEPESSVKHSKSAYFFNSHDHLSERDFYVKDVVRSTSAAPTYFAPAKIKNLADGAQLTNIDGGVFANNPTLCAYSEARNSRFDQLDYPSAKDMLILSLGTGGGQFALPPVKESPKWGVINWAKSIPEIMMDGSTDTINYHLEKLFSTLSSQHQKNYKRIDVAVEDRQYASNMADASGPNIEKLRIAGEKTISKAKIKTDQTHGLDTFLQLLIDNDPTPLA